MMILFIKDKIVRAHVRLKVNNTSKIFRLYAKDFLKKKHKLHFVFICSNENQFFFF